MYIQEEDYPMEVVKRQLVKIDELIKFIIHEAHHDCDMDEEMHSRLGKAIYLRGQLYGVMRRMKEVEKGGGVCEFPEVAELEFGLSSRAEYDLFIKQPAEWAAKRIKELIGDVDALDARTRSGVK